MLQSPGVSKREKIKETLKRLNPFKFKESKSGSNTLSRSSEFASASTFASSSALDHTNEAEVRVSFGVQPITLPQTHGRSKRRTAWNGFRNVVDMVGQAADVFPPLKSAIGAVAAILKTYDQVKGNQEKAASLILRLESFLEPGVDELDANELRRRSELEKALKAINKKLGQLMDQNVVEMTANNVQDNELILSCIEDLRDALTDYQVSLQKDLALVGKEIIDKVDLLLLDKLPNAKTASHTSGDRERCLKGTRVDVLNTIWAWAINESDLRAYWLNGTAGSGKSTIAQTFAEWCFAEEMLGASFFCSRESKDRSDVHLIFPTLAFQLAYRYPAFRAALIKTIELNPNVGHESLTEQLETLLIKPLLIARISTIIVIDALDECKQDTATPNVLFVVGRVVEKVPLVKFFITGRPEPLIRSEFRSKLLAPYTAVFRLHEVERTKVDDDIKTYLLSKLPQVIKNRSDCSISELWPNAEDIAVLVQKCNGLFIFAATTYRFLNSDSEDPRELLNQVVHLPGSTVQEGLTGLDAFYTTIMSANVSPNRTSTQVVSHRKMVMGAITTALDPLSPLALANLLNLSPNQVKTSLRNLHSIVLVPDLDSDSISIYHKSFSDYLTDPKRCRDSNFYINLNVQHATIAIKCLELMGKELKENIFDLPRYAMNKEVRDISTRRKDQVSDELEYACRFWAYHLKSCCVMGEDAQSIKQLLKIFFENHLLRWLEVMSLADKLRVAVYSLAFVKEWLLEVDNGADSTLLDWAKDTERYVLYCFDVIRKSAPHIYESSIFWLPLSSLVRKQYSNHLETKIKSLKGVSSSWERCTRTIQAGSRVNSVVFSDDGKFIAATGRDRDTGFLWIYEAATGTTVVKVERDDGELRSAAFSRDGSLVFAGSTNNKIIAWDVQTGGLVRIYEGYRDYVRSFALSPSGSSVALGSRDNSVRIWDIASGNCTCVLEGHTAWVGSICWSPDGDRLVSGSDDNSVRLWNPETGLCLNATEAHTSLIRSVAYSPDSSSFASGSWDQKIKLYDSNTGAVLQSILVGSDVNSISFSPCSTQILCGTDESSFIWDIEKEVIFARFDQTRINCAAFSPTGTSMVSGSHDGVLRLWEVLGDSHDQPPDASDHPAKSVVTQIIHSPDGGLLVSGSVEGSIGVWDAATNLCIHTFVGHTKAIRKLAFSPDATLLVSGSMDKTVRVWDIPEKRQIWVLEGHSHRDGIGSVQFISNGTQILSRSWDSIKLWDVKAGEILATMRSGDYFMDTDGVQVISNQDDSGSTYWVIQSYKFKHPNPTSELPTGFVPTQERRYTCQEPPKPKHQYRYFLEDGCIIDQRHRAVSWLDEGWRWVWSDQDPSAGERFSLYDPLERQGRGLNDEWVVDREGRRILWMPQDRRGPSSSLGKKLAVGLEDGRVMLLDFTEV